MSEGIEAVTTSEPPERRYRDLFGARSVIGALVIVGVLTIFAVGIPALDEAVKESDTFAVGSAHEVSDTTSFTPAPGWEIDPAGTTPGQVVTAHKNGWTIKVIGAFEVPPGQTLEEFVKIFQEGDKSNKDEFTQVSDIESFVTASGQTGATWTAHGPQDAAQQWDVADGTYLGQMRADGTAANLDTVRAELDEMAKSLVVTAAKGEGSGS
jgi:hypothetical protein